MDGLFGDALSNGPLSGILGNYKSNKLLSKTRITAQEREEFETSQLTKKEKEINKRKKRKRKEIEMNDNTNYMIPTKIAKKMKFSNPSSYHKHIKNKNKNNDNDDIDIDLETKKFTKSIILGSTEENKKLLNSLDDSNDDNKNSNKSTANNSNDNKSNKNGEKSHQKLTNKQVITRLRELLEPIRFFGETDDRRRERLRRLEMQKHEKEEIGSKGLKNDFNQCIKNEVEKELEAAMAKAMNDENKKDDDQILDNKSNHLLMKKTKYDLPRDRSSFDRSEDFVLFFFKRMLREWELSLLNRSSQEKSTSFGKNQTMLQKQARRDIRALFKQLKNRTVPSDVLYKSEKMVFATMKKNYVEAKKIFFEMAIGNAPWPMGVTMVGIHERSGRSKIFSSQIAHVMNDEIQRKYIHAMARIISFAQSKYPNDDPVRNMG